MPSTRHRSSSASTPPAVTLTDVSDPRQLRSYAATAQVAYMDAGLEPGITKMTQNEIAKIHAKIKQVNRGNKPDPTAGVGGDATPNDPSGNFSRALRNGPTIPFLQALDTVILGRAPQLSRAGGLAAFAARLSGVRSGQNVEATISPFYQPFVLAIRNPPPIILLLQATILLAEFEEPGRPPSDVRNVHRETLAHVVDGLIQIGSLAPTPSSVDALILLGSISRYAFDLVEKRLDRALRTPLGFRVWRALAAVVLAIKADRRESSPEGEQVRDWVERQLSFCERLRQYSLYPARSLDLELAIAIPKIWSPPERDWAGDRLRARAKDSNATLRERGTAVFGLWERAWDGEYQDAARDEIFEFITDFRREASRRPGLKWVAGTLEQNVRRHKKILTTWPDLDEPCQRVIRDAGRELDSTIPNRIRAATETLFQHAVIKNAGVHRRRAIDAIRAGGWAAQVIPALRAVLRHPQADPWLRCRALFALGFMQERRERAQVVLREACEYSWDRLKRLNLDDSQATRVRVIEVHAALFAVGDCFGDPAGEQAAAQIREQLDELLQRVVTDVVKDDGRFLVPVGRALSYLLATTAHVRSTSSKNMLDRLVTVSDPPTRHMSIWGLSRFTEHGIVKQAHEVPFEPMSIED
ncbi:hypothetical protein ABZ388_20825 [Micromonospora parva]|uniref:hypothetical protein n=1 Tax=Micromonospora parva TaxID=1464048 RepID=UPI00340D0128